MVIYLKYFIGVLPLLLLYPSVLPGAAGKTWTARNLRVKRQDGYVYDKPNVSFDLPTRSTYGATQPTSTPTVQSTQAQAVDRTQSQYMYYAYPVPSGGGGDVVNIGYTSTGTASNTARNGGAAGPPGGEGYNYGTPNAGSSATQTSISSGQSGYNYNTVPSTIGSTTTATVPSGGYNTGAQTQASIASSPTGYNYNPPTSTARPDQGAPAGTTNAPKYLPPTDGGNVNTGISVNIPSGPGGGVSTEVTVNVPSGPTGPAATPDAAYLPPSPSPPSPTPQPIPTPFAPQPSSEPPSAYLPPKVSLQGSPGQNTVFTPASTYLPPVF